MSLGKRLSADEPLTEHDVAERLSHAMLRCWRILAELTQDPELGALVKHSRYLVVQPSQLLVALEEFIALDLCACAFRDHPHPKGQTPCLYKEAGA